MFYLLSTFLWIPESSCTRLTIRDSDHWLHRNNHSRLKKTFCWTWHNPDKVHYMYYYLWLCPIWPVWQYQCPPWAPAPPPFHSSDITHQNCDHSQMICQQALLEVFRTDKIIKINMLCHTLLYYIYSSLLRRMS